MDVKNSVKQMVMDIDNMNVKNKMWTNEEFEMKKNIEKCAYQDLSRNQVQTKSGPADAM